MRRGFSETMVRFMDLIEDYIGKDMKDFGSQHRTGSVYPAFIEISYIRRNLYNILVTLRQEFSLDIVKFIENWQSFL